MLTDTQIEQTASRKNYSIRAIDCMTAMGLIAIAAPILVLKYLYRRCRYGAALEQVNIVGVHGKKVGLYQFTGDGICRQWPHLFNLLKGELSLVGAESVFYLTQSGNTEPTSAKCQANHLTKKLNLKPGLLTFKQMHQRVGLNFEHTIANEHAELCNAQKNALCYLLAACRIVFTALFINKKTDKEAAIIPLLNLELTNLTMSEMINNIIKQSQSNKQAKQAFPIVSQTTNSQQAMVQYAFVNADCLNLTFKSPNYLSCLQSSCKSVFADGSGIRLASQWKGYCPKDNLNGTDMFPRLCEQLKLHNMSVFLLGGEPGIAEKTAFNMHTKFPGLKVAGTHHGFLDTTELNQAAITQINQSGADVLLVAMGAPKQELWLEQYQPQLNVAVGIGVGGLFDFYSDKIKRAPLWVRQIGMEWTCRLAEEPKRMWKRYIIGNPLFLLRVMQEIIQEKRQCKSIVKLNGTKQEKREGRATRCKLLNLTEPQIDNSRALIRCKRQLAISSLNAKLKRLVDIVCASTLLILLTPLFTTVAILIRLESKGAVLFCQQRAGKDNAPFTMWKFRSMYQDAEQRLSQLQATNEMQGGVLFKMKRDPRITFIGKLIRKASIDELPQLWNVIRGDMSLVGPRPALLSEVKQYSLEDRRRLAVKPGITCIWQVTGRSNIPFDKQVELDVDYIYQQSFVTDIWLLIKTIPAVIFARGAY